MKSIAIFLITMLLTFIARGQTKNYKPKPEDFRIVEGTLYNIQTSTNWSEIPESSEYFYCWLKVFQVLPEGVIFQRGAMATKRNEPFSYHEKCLVQNYPGKDTLITGKSINQPIRVMRVGVFKYGSESIAAYDYGLPNTPENRKRLKNAAAKPKP